MCIRAHSQHICIPETTKCIFTQHKVPTKPTTFSHVTLPTSQFPHLLQLPLLVPLQFPRTGGDGGGGRGGGGGGGGAPNICGHVRRGQLRALEVRTAVGVAGATVRVQLHTRLQGQSGRITSAEIDTGSLTVLSGMSFTHFLLREPFNSCILLLEIKMKYDL